MSSKGPGAIPTWRFPVNGRRWKMFWSR